MSAIEKSSRRFRLPWFLIGLALLIGVPVGLFFAAGALVNSVSIPPDVAAPPPALAKYLPPPTPQPKPSPVPSGRKPQAMPAPRKNVPPPSYEDAVRVALSANPNLESARLYLELYEKLHENEQKLDMEINNVFVMPPLASDPDHRPRSWEPEESLPTTATQWMQSHRDLVDLFLRHCDCGGAPLPASVEMKLHQAIDSSIIWWTVKISAAEGRRLFDSGDTTVALRRFWAIIEFDERMHRSLEPSFPSYGMTEMAIRFLIMMADRYQLPEDQANKFMDILDRMHAIMKTSSSLAESIVRENYAPLRRQALAQARAAWNSKIYGWDFNDFHRYEYYYQFIHRRLPDIPRLDRIALTGIKAMNRKRQAPRYLAELDDYWLKAIERSRLSYPQFRNAQPIPFSRDNLFLAGSAESFNIGYENWLIASLFTETRLNLWRAALEWKLKGLQAPPLAPETNLQADHENRWRDPFTERPLRVAETTTATLIYSLGPDLKDQGGRILCPERYGGEKNTPGDMVQSLSKTTPVGDPRP